MTSTHNSLPKTLNLEGLEGNAVLAGQMQAELGEQWAAVYADPTQPTPDKNAEIILRNPAVYFHSVSPSQLPEDLRQRWDLLLQLTETTVRTVAPAMRWNPSANPLEKLQSLVFSGEVSASLRGTVADIMRNSSALFAESTVHQPGDTRYYAGNIRGAASWLKTATPITELG